MTRQFAAAALAAAALALAPVATATPQEDDPGWSCVTMGDQICGPDSDDQGHTPGCYSDTGELVAPWPCYLVVNPDGSADVFTGSAS